MRDTETEKRHWYPVYGKIKIFASGLPVGPAPQEAVLSPSLAGAPQTPSTHHPRPVGRRIQ